MKPRGKDRRRFKRNGDQDRRILSIPRPNMDHMFPITIGLVVGIAVVGLLFAASQF